LQEDRPAPAEHDDSLTVDLPRDARYGRSIHVFLFYERRGSHSNVCYIICNDCYASRGGVPGADTLEGAVCR
jgi:hypothetical protein